MDLHLVQDGTKMSFYHGFKIKTQISLLATELDCSFLQVHKFVRILTNYFFEFSKFCSLLSGTAILLGLGIHKYQDQIQESTGQITQSIKDAYEPLGPYLGEAKAKMLGFLDDVKQKVMSFPSAFSTEPEPEE